jgi:multidrug efflux system membrane fusion protein
MRASVPFVVVPFAVLLAGCAQEAPVFAPPPPPEVTVAKPVQRTVPVTLDATGSTRSAKTVEIRPRVQGFLHERHVDGGQQVEAGALLFTIDPRPFEIRVRQREAELAAAKAQAKLAEVTLDRTTQAVERNAAPKIQLDRASAEQIDANARVELAEATLAAAKLDLEFTRVTAPMSGRLGVRIADPGDLVGENSLLTTLVDDRTVYATYTIDERQLVLLRKLLGERPKGQNGEPELEVRMGVGDERDYGHVGRFHHTDNAVDPTTGTIVVEAIFDNADGRLLPGLFVRTRCVLREELTWTVPEIAIANDPQGRYVLVVGADGKVERRPVVIGGLLGGHRSILEGLTGTEAIVVNGLQRARPGTVVVPKEAAPSATGTGR